MENENEKCVLTIDKFCDDTENFDNLSVGAEAIVDSVKGLNKEKGLLEGSTFGTACTSLQSPSPTIWRSGPLVNGNTKRK